ncbi:MAG: MliC family protein [Candidatus Paceibacterota bacterium]
MVKKIIIIVLVLAVVIFLGGRYLKQPSSVAPNKPEVPESPKESASPNIILAVFNCDGGVSIKAEFNNNEPQKVSLEISDGRKIELPRAMSGSGARYADAQESFVFWNKGDTAFIEENGTTTISGCLAK